MIRGIRRIIRIILRLLQKRGRCLVMMMSGRIVAAEWTQVALKMAVNVGKVFVVLRLIVVI